MTTEFFYKAQDNLKVAQMCFDSGFYDACANRAYYAALQAAVAALADKKWLFNNFVWQKKYLI